MTDITEHKVLTYDDGTGGIEQQTVEVGGPECRGSTIRTIAWSLVFGICVTAMSIGVAWWAMDFALGNLSCPCNCGTKTLP